MRHLVWALALCTFITQSFCTNPPIDADKDRTTPSETTTIPGRPLSIGDCMRIGDLRSLQKIISSDSKSELKVPHDLLHRSFLWGHADIAEYVINEMGVDVNARGFRDETALFWAVRTNQIHMLKVFVDHGGDVNLRNRLKHNVLHHAVAEGFLEFAVALLDLGVSPNQVSEYMGSPLHYAVIGGNLDCVELLIKRGASLDLQNSEGRTPLYVACQRANAEVAQLLIDSGASVQVEGSDETVLHQATKNGLLAISRLLLEKNIEVEAKDSYGRTASFWALGTIDATDHLSLLKAHGASFDVRERSGGNLITELAEIGSYRPLELLDFLVEQGVDVEPNALERAKKNGKTDLVEALKRYLPPK